MSQQENNASTPPDSLEIPCDEARVYLHLAVEDELDALRWTQLGPHLETCADCARRHEELQDEKRWLLAGMLHTPQLRGNFANSLCAQLEAEGATPFDIADPLADPLAEPLADSSDALAESANAAFAAETVASETVASEIEDRAARRRHSERRWTLREALPWLSAAAVAVFFAALAGVFEREPNPASSSALVVRLSQDDAAIVSDTDTVIDSEGVSEDDSEHHDSKAIAKLTPTSASRAEIDTSWIIAKPPSASVNSELVSVRKAHSPKYSCSLLQPRPILSCPQVDVFVDAVTASTSPKVIPNLTPNYTQPSVSANSPLFGVPRARPRAQSVTPRITVRVHEHVVQNGNVVQNGARESSRHFGQVFGLMARLSVHRRTSPAPEAEANDPCAQDPNEDGALDIVDVTHLCREIMQPDAAVAASSLALAATPTVDEIDCGEEEGCI